MTKLDMKIDAIIKVVLAEDPTERNAARKELRRLAEDGVSAKRDAETITRELLLELGAPDHLVGHPYTVQAILLVVQDRTYINSITFGLYPQLAVMFDTTASRVERAIRHLIEVTWDRGDWDTLNRYFGNTVSPEKGKPTNGEFIARIANVVKLLLNL